MCKCPPYYIIYSKKTIWQLHVDTNLVEELGIFILVHTWPTIVSLFHLTFPRLTMINAENFSNFVNAKNHNCTNKHTDSYDQY